MSLQEKILEMQNEINTYLNSLLKNDDKYISSIVNSMHYSVFAGGKRIRPILMLATGELFDCKREYIMPYAAAIELIHTYSLIHDDLPAMDNDDYRRGTLTNHKVFGDAIAILAGDGLLNFAHEHMIENSIKENNIKYLKAAYEISKAAGINGMIAGQIVDIESENKEIDFEKLNYMHKNKTGALIKASVLAGAIISDAKAYDLEILAAYADKLGLAFQIIDDILDVKGDFDKIGKNIGSDIKKNKTTYVSFYGIDKAEEIAKKLSLEAIDLISEYGKKSDFLIELTNYLLKRNC